MYLKMQGSHPRTCMICNHHTKLILVEKLQSSAIQSPSYNWQQWWWDGMQEVKLNIYTLIEPTCTAMYDAQISCAHTNQSYFMFDLTWESCVCLTLYKATL